MKIRDMHLLLRVAQTSSMTLAAQQLHLTPAAVSAAVHRVEEEIGVRIFDRTTRTLGPTEEGRLVLEGCQEVVSRWQRTLDDVRGEAQELEGTVHLSAPADTAYELLEPLLPTLTRAHPSLRVVLHVGDAIQHLHRDAIDMAIRYGRLQDNALLARRLVRSPTVLVASPAYLERQGTPQTLEELASHDHLALRLAGVPMTTWSLTRERDTHLLPLNVGLCGDGYLARRWALQGFGIALKSLFDVLDDLEAGRLVHVLPAYCGDPFDIHVVFPSRRFLPARVRAIDALVSEHFHARAARCQAWRGA